MISLTFLQLAVFYHDNIYVNIVKRAQYTTSLLKICFWGREKENVSRKAESAHVTGFHPLKRTLKRRSALNCGSYPDVAGTSSPPILPCCIRMYSVLEVSYNHAKWP